MQQANLIGIGGFRVPNGLNDAVRSQPEAVTLKQWLDLATGDLTFSDYYEWARQLHQLSCLTVDVTPICDLTCEGMCYYHPGIDKRQKLVEAATLNEAISTAAQHLNMRTVVVAGKEPFLNPDRLFEVLRFAGPSAHRHYTIGTVTNGRHVSRHLSTLARLSQQGCLDFLDISLDSGYSAQHDEFRGRSGTFDLAFPAVCEAARLLTDTRVGVASVLRADNAAGLLHLVEQVAAHTRHLFLTPMQPPPFSTLAPLDTHFVTSFLRQLHVTLEALTAAVGMEITVLLPGIYVLEAADEGLFDIATARENAGGAMYVQRTIGQHTVLYLLSVLPEQASRVARIASTGAYLAHLHFMQTPDPSTHAVGFIQNESIVSLYERAIGPGSPFEALVESRTRHHCRDRICWSSCFGGWTVADNALVTGDSLILQPRMCQKGR